jgi:hypothetical protein
MDHVKQKNDNLAREEIIDSPIWEDYPGSVPAEC